MTALAAQISRQAKTTLAPQEPRKKKKGSLADHRNNEEMAETKASWV